MPENKLEISIRLILKADISKIIEIDEESSLDPLTSKECIKILKKPDTAGFIAESSNGTVLGFLILEVFEKRFQVLHFAVSPKYRRKRVGYTLINYIKDQLVPTKRQRIVVEIRDSNVDGQLFFQACKFRATQVLRDYYESTHEDCYQLEYRLNWPQKDTINDKKGAFAKKFLPKPKDTD